MPSIGEKWLTNKSRIIQAVSGSFLKLILTFLTVRLVANTIGSEEYGHQMFLIAVSQSLKPLMDLGMSSSFFTMISQQPGDKVIVFQYLRFVVFMWFLVVFLIVISTKASVINLIWLNSKTVEIILVLSMVYVVEIVWIGITRIAEALRLCLISSWYLKQIGFLNTVTYCVISLSIWLSVSAAIAAVVHKKMLALSPIEGTKIDRGSIAKIWISRSKPLVILSIIQAAIIYIDRWALQKFGGSSEQANFALALQMSTAVLFATSAAVEVLWRDTADAQNKSDSNILEINYNFISSRCLLLTSIACSTIILWGERIFESLFNKEYSKSIFVLYVLSVYSCYLSWSQVSGVWFYATNKTRRYVLIYTIANLSGTLSVGLLTFMYFASDLLAGLGGTILSLKMLVTQFIIGNLQYHFICSTTGWFWDWAIQIRLIVVPIIMASAVNFFAVYIFGADSYLCDVLKFLVFMSFLFAIRNLIFQQGLGFKKQQSSGS
jgi:O-antigen/teichoic acid export membrane protein